MGCIVEFLMELIFETLFEGFIGLCTAFIPQKSLSKRAKNILTIVFLLFSLALLVGLVFGIVLLVECGGKSFWGWLLVAVNIIYVIAGIVLKIRPYK